MITEDIDDLILVMDNYDRDTTLSSKQVELIIDALQFYKEMQVL